jgi:hypothetical protein
MHAGEWRSQNTAPEDIERHIASADLLNPSDALDLLARVADRDADGDRVTSDEPSRTAPSQQCDRQDISEPNVSYPPLEQDAVSYADIAKLVDQ